MARLVLLLELVYPPLLVPYRVVALPDLPLEASNVLLKAWGVTGGRGSDRVSASFEGAGVEQGSDLSWSDLSWSGAGK